jgi:hypothetical protein
MFLRIRWFTLGVIASLGAAAYAANQLRRMRERLTPQNLAREGVRGLAGVLEAAADRLEPVPARD